MTNTFLHRHSHQAMTTLRRFAGITALSLGLIFAVTMVATSSPAQTVDSPNRIKTVVLVHGAWADGSSWSKVIPLLKADGIHVLAVQLPLTSLADDVATVKRALALEQGPLILVGHSYGGVVITEAGTDPKVVGLVYVAAFAPDVNQSAQTLNAEFPATPVMTNISADKQGFLKLTEHGIYEDFAQDLSPNEKSNLFATQGPTFMNVLGTPVSSAAWQTKPSWFIVAANDRVISPELESAMALTIHATIRKADSSHVVMLSKPRLVADVIKEAARNLDGSLQ